MEKTNSSARITSFDRAGDLQPRISLAAAMRFVGCTDERTLAAALRRHNIPLLRLGRKRSMLVSDLQKLIEACTYYQIHDMPRRKTGGGQGPATAGH